MDNVGDEYLSANYLSIPHEYQRSGIGIKALVAWIDSGKRLSISPLWMKGFVTGYVWTWRVQARYNNTCVPVIADY